MNVGGVLFLMNSLGVIKGRPPAFACGMREKAGKILCILQTTRPDEDCDKESRTGSRTSWLEFFGWRISSTQNGNGDSNGRKSSSKFSFAAKLLPVFSLRSRNEFVFPYLCYNFVTSTCSDSVGMD
ncbi:hypothetical protein CEXT_661271 [Caerostris extrusa]|uniref:Secreted protein n=1 Tax=Caerostris extrusa TaxID=172846 RepID=A0AAV4XQ08_CAEEX|nr:hypothetical protein CEXT_661271 [Caerostris extrusa]